jgi:hypothetical protein
VNETSDRTHKRYLFLLGRPNEESVRLARSYLRELGVRVTSQHGAAALIGLATPDQVEAAAESGLFATITAGALSDEGMKKLEGEQLAALRVWNTRQSADFIKLSKDKTEEGKSWDDREKDAEPPHTTFDPRDFKRELLEFLKVEENELLEKYREEKPRKLEGDTFVEYERELAKRYDNATLAYELARLAYHLGPEWYRVIADLPQEFIAVFFLEAQCWKLEGEISVGVVFVESSRDGGPKFSTSTRNNLEAEITDGLDWLADEAPAAANVTWVYDWQYVSVDVANGTNSSTEDYWRDPAMAQVSYHGNSYSAAWSSVAEYRDDMRVRNRSAHALVIFVTPYATEWHAYASGRRVTLANRNNWGGWGIGTIDRITAHEVCHLFGSADEYTGSGTPCSSCSTLHGCYSIPNGNCGACARPFQDCVMDSNQKRLCPWTRAHIGWCDLFVELTTADEAWAGTDDTVWLDIGDRTFVLDTPNHDDRERNNVDGYPLSYTGVTRNDVKRVGIRKSSDGFAGGWKLKRVRLWVREDLICDANNINQWLEDEYRWWASTTCGTSSDIVNRLQVRVTTADVMWAGTDDDVTFYMGGKSWNLDNPGHDDFERGNTDSFDLDPGTGLYRSALGAIRIHKSPDGVAGGWKLKGLRIYVNGTQIYSNQSINKWLEDSDRDWYGNI